MISPTENLEERNAMSNNKKSVLIEKNKSDADYQTRSLTKNDNTLVKSLTKIGFYYGNPTVDIVKGFIHIYKDRFDF